MVSPQGRRLAQVLHDQFALQADSATVVRVDSAFARYLRGDDSGDVPVVARTVLLPPYRNYIRSLAAYDPVDEVRRLRVPLLILQGTTDVQISMRDAELLAAAQPRATMVRLVGANHALKHVSSTALDVQMASYKDPSLPLHESVLPAILGWMETRRR